MSAPVKELWSHPDAAVVLEGISAVFTSLGRALVCLGPDFRIVHTSLGLDHLVGAPVHETLLGLPAEEILGSRLFGDDGLVRAALAVGERREGWGATLRARDPKGGETLTCDVSLTASPLTLHSPVCDPRVAYLVVLRPHESTSEETPRGATVFNGMIARSAAMLRIFSLIEHLRESEATVLVTGESGTGKELVARALHRNSPRGDGPFVTVNCGALPDDLLESELFGHVRGAFTGAVRDRTGRFEFELDAGGTLFLDEVGDLPLHLQVKILRVLQERTIERVGESRPCKTDARIVAATHHDLRRDMLEERFRDDLYYRLRVVPVEVPPLRERREDVEPLTEHLLERIAGRTGRNPRLAPDVLPWLLRYPWPGNVLELENALEFAVAVCRGQTIHVRDLPPEIVDPSKPPLGTSYACAVPLTEKDRLADALEAHHWRRDETARSLGMSRTTLWRKMREHGLLE